MTSPVARQQKKLWSCSSNAYRLSTINTGYDSQSTHFEHQARKNNSRYIKTANILPNKRSGGEGGEQVKLEMNVKKGYQINKGV